MYFLNQAGWQYISVSQLTKTEVEKQLEGIDATVHMSMWNGSGSNITVELNSGDGKAFLAKCQELWPNGQETYSEGGWPQYYIPLFYNKPKAKEVYGD